MSQHHRGTAATRNRHRKAIRRTQPPCALCLAPIDYTLRSPDPLSFEVDHVIPIAKGGEDTLENKQAVHRKCNQAKSDALDYEHVSDVRTFVTARSW